MKFSILTRYFNEMKFIISCVSNLTWDKFQDYTFKSLGKIAIRYTSTVFVYSQLPLQIWKLVHIRGHWRIQKKKITGRYISPIFRKKSKKTVIDPFFTKLGATVSRLKISKSIKKWSLKMITWPAIKKRKKHRFIRSASLLRHVPAAPRCV